MSKRRSFWGWGYEEQLPDEAERRDLASVLDAVLQFEAREPAPYPTLDTIELPEPRLAIPPELVDFCHTDARIRAERTYGRGYPDVLRGFRGDFSAAPDLVAQPRNEDDLRTALQWAARNRVAVVPRGGGTSVVKGTEFCGEGFAGVLCLDLGHLDKVLEVDDHSLAARIQAGATGPVLEAQLAAHGLTLRHYPQSFEFSTLGGWIATRAGGHFATRYTHIDDLVESVRMVTADDTWESRRLPGSGAGPSPDRWIIGSEGILGVITEAWMRVFRRPRYRAKATVHFDDWSNAVAAVKAIAQARLYPSNCRLLDNREALINQVAAGVHVLLLGFESADIQLKEGLTSAIQLAEAQGGIVADGPTYTDDESEQKGMAKSWRDAFLRAPYRLCGLISLGIVADTFETAITWDRFEALHADVISSVRGAMKAVAGKGFLSCRFTHVYPDGPAPYYTFLFPGRSGEELTQWRAVKKAAGDALMRNSATITHHHAVGRLHRPWYDQQRPEPFAQALRATKHALDPAGVLNPGVLIDP